TSAGSISQAIGAGLPNFDIRRKQDAPIATVQSAPIDDPVLRDRVRSIESFRRTLSPEASNALSYEINQARVPKKFFSTAPLSAPRQGLPDRIARDFLRGNSSIFGLSEPEVEDLKLEGEDNDAGTTFLNYEQQISSITVFHGHVRVVVDSLGQILSVNQGWLMPGYKVKAKPKLKEVAAIKRSFEAVGKQRPESLTLVEERDSVGGRATFANPLGGGYENIVSDLRVMEVDEAARLAWHFYLDVAPSEWYEVCLDASTG